MKRVWGFIMAEKRSPFDTERRLVLCADPLTSLPLWDATGAKAAAIGVLYTGEVVRVLAASDTEALVRTAADQYGFVQLADLLPLADDD